MSSPTALAVVDVTKMTTQIVIARGSITDQDREIDTRAGINSQIVTQEARIMELGQTDLVKHIIEDGTRENGTMTSAAVVNHTIGNREINTIANLSISTGHIMDTVDTTLALTTAHTITLLTNQALSFLVFNRKFNYLLLKDKLFEKVHLTPILVTHGMNVLRKATSRIFSLKRSGQVEASTAPKTLDTLSGASTKFFKVVRIRSIVL